MYDPRAYPIYMRAWLILAGAWAGVWLGLFPTRSLAQVPSPYQSAVAHVQQGHNDLAIPILNQLVASSPRDLKARNLLGIALLNLGRREEAAAQFRRAVEIDAAFYPALKNLAIAELSLGRRVESRSHFEQVLKLAPDDAVTHLNLAEMDYADARYAHAFTHYQRSDGLHLKDGDAALRAMRAAASSGHSAEAIQMAEQLGRPVAVLRVLAQAYEQSGDTQRAYDSLRSATQLEPANEAVYVDLLSLCVDHQTFELALQISAAALERLPRSFRVRLQRGAVFALKGEVDAAEHEFAEAALVAPEEVLPQVTLALARVQLGRVPEAVSILRAAQRRHPKDYIVNWILGETLAQQPESENEAIRVLDEAARLGPQEAAPKVLLGKLLARRGDLTRATRELEAALKIQPNDTSAQYQLATVYRKAGNLKRADELFEKVGNARLENPDDSSKRNLQEVIRHSAR
jgi:tetratricopeptide (TPR) repeat protein